MPRNRGRDSFVVVVVLTIDVVNTILNILVASIDRGRSEAMLSRRQDRDCCHEITSNEYLITRNFLSFLFLLILDHLKFLLRKLNVTLTMSRLMICKYQSYYLQCLLLFSIRLLINLFNANASQTQMTSHWNLLVIKNFFCMTCVGKRACIRDNEICTHCKILRHEQNKCIAISLLIVIEFVSSNIISVCRVVSTTDETREQSSLSSWASSSRHICQRRKTTQKNDQKDDDLTSQQE